MVGVWQTGATWAPQLGAVNAPRGHVCSAALGGVWHAAGRRCRRSPGGRMSHISRRRTPCPVQPCANFLYRFKAAPMGPLAPPPRRPGRRSRWRSRSSRPGRRSAGAKGRRAGPLNPRKSRSRGRFDTGTPRGGSIGLMRATWEGHPIADKRTAAAVSNPPLCRCVPGRQPSLRIETSDSCQGPVDSSATFDD
jgi:hypothetical protein